MRGVTHVTAKQVVAARQSFDEMMGDDPFWSALNSEVIKRGELVNLERSRQAVPDRSDVDAGVT